MIAAPHKATCSSIRILTKKYRERFKGVQSVLHNCLVQECSRFLRWFMHAYGNLASACPLASTHRRFVRKDSRIGQASGEHANIIVLRSNIRSYHLFHSWVATSKVSEMRHLINLTINLQQYNDFQPISTILFGLEVLYRHRILNQIQSPFS